MPQKLGHKKGRIQVLDPTSTYEKHAHNGHCKFNNSFSII